MSEITSTPENTPAPAAPAVKPVRKAVATQVAATAEWPTPAVSPAPEVKPTVTKAKAKAKVKPAAPANPVAKKAVAKKVSSKPAVPAKKASPAKVVKAAKPVVKAVKAKPAAAAVEAKPVKVKLVRDSFTIPAGEYAQLAALKHRALKAAYPAKKSELLRAGIRLLAALPDKDLLAALQALPAIKTGRPKGKKGE